jgi:UPF0755 protein
MLHKISRPFKYLIVLGELLLVLSLFILAYNFFVPLGKGTPFVYFDDTNTSAVLKRLSKRGYKITDWDPCYLTDTLLPRAGWYHITHQGEGRYHFFSKLGSEPAHTMKVKVYAGETYVELTRRVANDMKLNAQKLKTLYEKQTRFKEADIFAGTYLLPRKGDENTTINHLFHTSRTALMEYIHKQFHTTVDDYTIKLLLTIASIIQKESNDPAEMPLIASVIYNRLGKGMKLQMDSTLNYGPYSHQIITSERIKNDTTYYNTYKYKGLPPTPLATVSLTSLHAAMFPAETNYLFFMLHKDGGHVFSATYKEHLAHLKAFRAYQKEREKCQDKESNTTAEKASPKLTKTP